MFRADAPLQNDFVQEPSTHAALASTLSTEDFQAVFRTEPRTAIQASLDFGATIKGYDDDREVTSAPEPMDTASANLTAEDSSNVSKVPPADRLSAAIMNLPENPTPAQVADATHEAAVALDDQLDDAEDAQEAYFNFDGLGTLLPQSQKEYETAYYALNPELQKDKAFVDNLATLPNLIYSGQTDKANSLMTGMLMVAGTQGKEQLEAYFDKLKSVAAANPELVRDYSGKFQTYKDALRTFDAMYRKFNESPLGQ